MNPKIAVVQFEIAQFQPQTNLERAEAFVAQASGNADVIVFPEDFVTGPIVGQRDFVDFNGEYLSHFQGLAREHGIDIAAGSWIEGSGNEWYNTAHYIDASGEVLGKYRKINLWHPERKYLTPGSHSCVFDTRFGKAGLIICWDLAFPEIFREMLKQEVQLVYCPSYWAVGDAGVGLAYDKDSETRGVNALCPAQAFMNEIALVYCNAAGTFQYRDYSTPLIGQSQIAVPFKGAVRRLDHNNEEMFIQEVDMQILRDAEKAYGIRKDIMQK